MSIVDDLNRINNIKNDIKQAIRDRGVEMEDNTPFAEYPNCIRNIEGGNPVYESYYNMKTDNGTSFGRLFKEYYGETLDISNYDSSAVTDMGDMFASCNNLRTIEGIADLATNNVTNMHGMFYCCYGLTSLDLSNWVTSNVAGMGSMFNMCYNLHTLDISNFDMSNVNHYDSMFSGCNSLHTLRLDNCNRDTVDKIINSADFPTDEVVDVNGIIGVRTIYCKGENLITALEAPTNWVFEYIDGVIPEEPEAHPYEPHEFRDNTRIREVETIVTSEHDNLEEMFRNCNNLVSVNTQDWDTSNVGNMNSMFSHCESLTELDLSNWNTGNVRDMNEMFNNCRELTTLNVSNWNTDNVEYMSGMFRNCEELTELDLSSFRTGNVREMNNMFAYCYKLTTLDISNWDTSNVENMDRIFSRCENLRELRLDNCNKDTIRRIIEYGELPEGDFYGELRRIYCKEENAEGIDVLDGWEFSSIEEDSCGNCGLPAAKCTCVYCEYCDSYDCDGSCQEEPSEE